MPPKPTKCIFLSSGKWAVLCINFRARLQDEATGLTHVAGRGLELVEQQEIKINVRKNAISTPRSSPISHLKKHVKEQSIQQEDKKRWNRQSGQRALFEG